MVTGWTAGVAVMAPLSGRLADRFPAGILGGIGLVAMMLGCLALAFLKTAPARSMPLAHAALRAGLRHVPDTQQPHPDEHPATRARRSRQRHAGHRPPDRPDLGRRPGRFADEPLHERHPDRPPDRRRLRRGRRRGQPSPPDAVTRLRPGGLRPSPTKGRRPLEPGKDRRLLRQLPGAGRARRSRRSAEHPAWKARLSAMAPSSSRSASVAASTQLWSTTSLGRSQHDRKPSCDRIGIGQHHAQLGEATPLLDAPWTQAGRGREDGVGVLTAGMVETARRAARTGGRTGWRPCARRHAVCQMRVIRPENCTVVPGRARRGGRPEHQTACRAGDGRAATRSHA